MLDAAQLSTICKLPAVSIEQAQAFVHQRYGIAATLKPLDGERDLNFLVQPVADPQQDESGSCSYVFKICNAQESADLLQLQSTVMAKMASQSRFLSIESVASSDRLQIETILADDGVLHLCRLTTFLQGALLSAVDPHFPELLDSLGQAVADFSEVVAGLDVDTRCLSRPLLWHMEQAVQVVEQNTNLVEGEEQVALLRSACRLFTSEVLPHAELLPRGVIHNDANDNNVVVSETGPWHQQVHGLIDFGDMVECWKVADLAVACAYAMLQKKQPLDAAVEIVRGYHRVRSLNQAEIHSLFPMIQMRLALSVSICARQKTIEPDNAYLRVSEKPAWQLLQMLSAIHHDYAHYLFRGACGLSPVAQTDGVIDWLSAQAEFAPICDLPDATDRLLLLDASVSSPDLDLGLSADSSGYDVDKVSRDLDRAMEDVAALTAIGRYDEYRLIYQSDDFIDRTGHQRTLHLGIDIFQAAGSAVYCPLDAVVYSVADHDEPFDYGGTLILQHDVVSLPSREPLRFYTLYGHLSPGSLAHWQAGQEVKAGDKIAQMGQPYENGNWPPHVHFQIMTSMLGEQDTFVGVGSHAHRDVWLSLCPNPNLMLRLPAEFINQPLSDAVRVPDTLHHQRDQVIPRTLSLSYRQPLSIARGAGQYLYDYTGRQYLDAVNNVPHVGHCHPRVVEAGRRASRVLNTNTRYLYPGLGQYAEQLLAVCPEPLAKVFFVNSGSEANDLALRMAACHTGRHHVLALEHGYHGNLGSLIDISGYKHDGPGGAGAPDWVRKLPLPDLLRDSLDNDSASVNPGLLQGMNNQSWFVDGLSAFIGETIPGCGGQVILPDGYLRQIYQQVRQSGGVCIADEVQTGFGRVGSHFWSFELQNVVPDILTIGKPAGNGHPIGAVITSNEIADSFTNGMEYFNTFGGNPVSCAIGKAVLEIIQEEGLQSHAKQTGDYLVNGLRQLADSCPLMADVRGAGLFLGVELAESRTGYPPAARQASYIAERMKQLGVLISTDGPHHNVLKIKPPMVFNRQDADTLLDKLDSVLAETGAQA